MPGRNLTSLAPAKRGRGTGRGGCDPLDRAPEVVRILVPVGRGREPDVAVPHDPLHVLERDARPEKQRRRRVAQVVEAHRPG
jgi:hypothetical protein